nr:skin secretory protein xP2 [Aedes albopictus]
MNGMKCAFLILAVIASVAWAGPTTTTRPDSADAPKPAKDSSPEVPAVVKETSQSAANATVVGKAPEAPKNQTSEPAPAVKDAKDAKDKKDQPPVDLSAESVEVKPSGKAPEPSNLQVDELVGAPFSIEFDDMQGDQPASVESGELVPAPVAGVVSAVDAKDQSALPVVVVDDKQASSGAKADSGRDAWGSLIDGIIGQLQDLKRKTRAIEELAHRK